MIDVPLANGRLRAERCLVMGILNATPDSFSDGGALDDDARLDARIRHMISDGADILDVGGESTRPGAMPVPSHDEIRRVVRVIEAIRRIDTRIPISIDTSKADVAEAALGAGASMVNDVTGLRDPAMGDVVRRHGCAVVLMRDQDIQGDIVAGANVQLAAAVERARAAKLPDDALILDPGLGFGARPGPHVADNLALLDAGPCYGPYPVLIGASRKRFVGAMADEPEPARRVAASVALAVRARDAGAAIVRVHDVAETVAALR